MEGEAVDDSSSPVVSSENDARETHLLGERSHIIGGSFVGVE